MPAFPFTATTSTAALSALMITSANRAFLSARSRKSVSILRMDMSTRYRSSGSIRPDASVYRRTARARRRASCSSGVRAGIGCSRVISMAGGGPTLEYRPIEPRLELRVWSRGRVEPVDHLDDSDDVGVEFLEIL